MRYILPFLLCFLLTSTSSPSADCRGNKPIIIAVLDSGFGYREKGHEAKLCKFGHKDFTIDRQFSQTYNTRDLIPEDLIGHGTNIVGVIDEYLRPNDVNYCIVIVKYYSPVQTGEQNTRSLTEAIKYATNIHANYVNISGGGTESSDDEKKSVKAFIDKKGLLIAAAGNNSENLDTFGHGYYPAMDDPRVIVVGNLSSVEDGRYSGTNNPSIISLGDNFYGIKSKTSNYGPPVNRWEIGVKISGFGLSMTGTSQAAAVATAKIVLENYNNCDIGLK